LKEEATTALMVFIHISFTSLCVLPGFHKERKWPDCNGSTLSESWNHSWGGTIHAYSKYAS